MFDDEISIILIYRVYKKNDAISISRHVGKLVVTPTEHQL
jgi:hypothetical protein